MTPESATAESGTLASFVARAERLDLETKVRLLTGETAWRLHAVEEIGLRSLALSDGPVGVRGTGETAGETSKLFPSPSAIAATWDPAVASRLGGLFAREARVHGVDLVLAPQVNIQRTPVGGRHFECFSEDALLTSLIASSLIASMQEAGVAASVKHFVANDSETDRTQYVAQVGEQAMREVYLAPFEHAVKTAGAWSVMSAYNRVEFGGEISPMTEHDSLINGLLKTEWGFDGLVVSDWLATQRTVESALSGLDIVMPGPGGPWEQHLVDAVHDGRVPESAIDDKVARILLLAERTEPRGLPTVDAGDDAFLRELAARSVVVLKRGADFPVDRPLRRVALIGPNAVSAYVLGGGSSTVHPEHVVSPAEGFRAALPGVEVTLIRGGDARRHAPVLDAAALATGMQVTYLDAAGAQLGSERLAEWTGWLRNLPEAVETVVLDAQLTLAEPGEHWIEIGTVGRYRFELDGEVIAGGNKVVGAEVILDSSINSPDGDGGLVTVAEPRLVPLRATLGVIRAGGYGSLARAELRHHRPGPSVEDEIGIAVEEASKADLVVLIVGTNDEVESEGWDRTSLRLPGRQDELVERVLAVAPDAVIVVNAGAPLVLPWLDRARTVLWGWFPGQECGHAIADVVLGRTEPAGRLPWTLPARESDVPVPNAIPEAGIVDYYEGVHVGYRSWEKNRRVPAAPFGHGLGWTDWRYDSVMQDPAAQNPVIPNPAAQNPLALDVTVTNTGSRPGTEVVQVYLEAPRGEFERPVRWLGGFATVTVAPGESATVRVELPRRSFEVWDVAGASWALPAGSYRAVVGRSVRDIRLERVIEIPGPQVPATEIPAIQVPAIQVLTPQVPATQVPATQISAPTTAEPDVSSEEEVPTP